MATKELPPPAARSVYTVTDYGRSAVPVLRALARWGMPLLEAPGVDQPVRPWTAVNAAIATYYDPVAAQGVDERYLFRVDGEEITLSTVTGRGVPHDHPDLTIESSTRIWIDIRQGRTTLKRAITDGFVTTAGPKRALKNLQKIFRLD